MNSETEKVRAEEMTDQELYRFLVFDRIGSEPDFVRAVCQEIEIREAARVGRSPAGVSLEEIDEYGRSYGSWIGLTKDFLEEDPTEPAAKILNTLLHEGRHEWQRYLHQDDDLQSENKDNLEYLLESECYCDGKENVVDIGLPEKIQGWIQYSMQEMEADARFYAIRRMQEIADACVEGDPLKLELEKEIDKAIGTELACIGFVVENLGDNEYRLLEEAKLEMLRKQYSLPIPDGFRCYDNIWMILNVVRPAYEHLLERTALTGERVLEQDKLMYKLYEAARIRKMEGEPLEKPIELELMAVSGEIGKLFAFAEQQVPPEKVGEPIPLERRSKAIGL